MSSLPCRRLAILLLSLSIAVIALASIYSLTLARPQAGTIIVNPGDSIQAAINSANPGDTVLINPGTYNESLTLNKAVNLTGVNSATVIISALPHQRVLTVSGAAINSSVVISGLTVANGNVTSGNTCPAYCGGGVLITGTAQPVMQNLIISNNMASLYGGGVYAYQGSPLMLINVNVFSNSISSGLEDGGGGGVFAYSGVNVNGGRFEHNRSNDHFGNGGGLSTYGTAVIAGAEFISNTGPTGGGLYAYTALINNSLFESNYSFDGGGGGLFAYQDLQLTNTTVISNATNTGGGGAVAYGSALIVGSRFENNRSINSAGGGLIASRGQPVTLIDTEFVGNVADFSGGGAYTCNATVVRGAFINNESLGGLYGSGQGGGLYDNCYLSLTGVQFIGNTAADGGGGVKTWNVKLNGGQFVNNHSNNGGALSTTTMAITGTTFIVNSANDSGGAVLGGSGRIVNALFAENSAGSNGAGLSVGACASVEILHSTIADTIVNARSAIYIPGACISLGVTDTIITSHTIGIEQSVNALVYEDYNLFFGNTTNLSGTVSGGTHDVFGDPNFINPTNGDYHIFPPSAAIDAGIDAGVYTDLDGNVRPSGSGFDIGAYEAAAATVPITGLNATNSGPTAFGRPTTLTATIEAGDVVTYRWDFGDGSALGNGQTVTHTYPAAGMYTASVTASNSLSTVTATTTITVYVTPIAGLGAINSSPTVLGQSTAFTATVNAGDLVSYTWNFGDGSATTNGITTTHAYPAVGIYTSSVSAQNSVSVMTATTRVTITDVPLSGLMATNSGPTTVGNMTILTATIGAGSNVTYTWDFGDGSSTTKGITATHAYPVTGVYTATVVAINSVSVMTATTRVTITDVPLSGLSAANNSPTAIGSVTTLTATINAGSNVTYTWNFGDGSATTMGQVVTHTYPFSTTFRFTATVTASNSINAQSATTAIIIVPRRVYLPVVIR